MIIIMKIIKNCKKIMKNFGKYKIIRKTNIENNENNTNIRILCSIVGIRIITIMTNNEQITKKN